MAEEYAVNFRAPVLPFPPNEYDSLYINQVNALLRVYFNQIDNTLRDTAIIDRSDAQGWFLG
jgi:hypothetical protein